MFTNGITYIEQIDGSFTGKGKLIRSYLNHSEYAIFTDIKSEIINDSKQIIYLHVYTVQK